ncbi:hypothetical protein QEM13_004494 [Pseudomonas putida]|nr:hypothetical protein [Pseudomonas putida]EKT4525133.1 hypothetical protein [Pseudomonas putida]
MLFLSFSHARVLQVHVASADTESVPVLEKSFFFKWLNGFSGKFQVAISEPERPISRQAVSA